MLQQRADFPHEQSVCQSNMSAALEGLVWSPLDRNEVWSAKTDGVGIVWGGVFLNSVEVTLWQVPKSLSLELTLYVLEGRPNI